MLDQSSKSKQFFPQNFENIKIVAKYLTKFYNLSWLLVLQISEIYRKPVFSLFLSCEFFGPWVFPMCRIRKADLNEFGWNWVKEAHRKWLRICLLFELSTPAVMFSYGCWGGAAGEPRRCLLGKWGITTIASNAYYCILIKLKILTFQVVWRDIIEN